MDNIKLAARLLPDVINNFAHFESAYPKRNEAVVTRFAPSPTGFLHIGNLFPSFISSVYAKKNSGIFYLRIEDTDKKREVENGVQIIVKGLEDFGIIPDEGITAEGAEKGGYAPYIQSKRRDIYRAYAKLLIEKGLAYPCFCDECSMSESKAEQDELKLRTGYYGKWAKCRNLSFDEIGKNLNKNLSFVLRLKSPGNENNRISFDDLIKGTIEMPENDMDIVILKSDGMPTYHFAHAVDDHLMGTTHVIRGDEWISSTPVHLQLFDLLGFKAPKYAHIAPIMKEDNGGKRKLSKRKDPEAAVSYYHEQGYPKKAVLQYFMTLANSNFEDWLKENPDEDIINFPFSLSKMSVSGALFDLTKLNDISKTVISKLTAAEVYDYSLAYAKDYDKELYSVLSGNKDYAIEIFGVERGTEKPRKDIACFADVKGYISYFYEDLWDKSCDMPENILKNDVNSVLERYIFEYNDTDTKEEWFARMKGICEPLGFSSDVKAYKKNPEAFKGHVGDISTIIRVAVTSRKNTPDLYMILKILGKDEVIKRLKNAIM